MRVSRQLFFNAALVAAVAGIYALHFAQRPPKLAYVENAKVLEGYKEMQEAKKQYQEEAMQWQANLDTLKQTVQREIDAYNRLRPTLTAPERRWREERLAERQKQYFTYKKAIGDKAAEEEARLTSKVVSKADSLMREYGKQKGYDIVFAATEAGTVVYGKQGVDITEDVLRSLNK